jgi:phosphoserine phosphatase RsbU/P
MSKQPHSSRTDADLALAVQVQRSFLPQRLPTVPGYEFFYHYQPACEIGGDHLAFCDMADGRVAAVILDVTGKGVAASLLKARVSGALDAYLLNETY